jgi:hypothetical protein
MWVNCLAGMVMGCTDTVCCLEALAYSHTWKSLHQVAASLLSPRHIILVAINRLVARDPAWTKPWKAAKIAGQSTKGTSSRTFRLETSQRSSTPPTVYFSTRCDLKEAVHCVSGQAPWWVARAA